MILSLPFFKVYIHSHINMHGDDYFDSSIPIILDDIKEDIYCKISISDDQDAFVEES
jgi:hypothetical protein